VAGIQELLLQTTFPKDPPPVGFNPTWCELVLSNRNLSTVAQEYQPTPSEVAQIERNGKLWIEEQNEEAARQKRQAEMKKAIAEKDWQSKWAAEPAAGDGIDAPGTELLQPSSGASASTSAHHKVICPRCGGLGTIGHTDAGIFNKVVVDDGPLRPCPVCHGTGYVDE
jgi:DnaJ-class molecular chaperone